MQSQLTYSFFPPTLLSSLNYEQAVSGKAAVARIE